MKLAVPGYDVLGVLGRGGHAVVYRAWQQAVGRQVALKVGNRVVHNERDRRRFEREVTAAGLLAGHPYVVGLFDAGLLDDGRPFLVLQVCPGGSLQERVTTKGPIGPVEVREIGVRIADAIAAAHEQNVLHRDVKPHNLLVTEYGHVALADFGVAAFNAPEWNQTATLEVMTPLYAAPETFHGSPPAPTADVYGLAATLYTLLAGRPPHCPSRDDQGALAWMTEITRLHGLPIPDVPGAPAALMSVLRGALAPDPVFRCESAARLRDELVAARLDAPEPVAVGAPGPEAATPPADSFSGSEKPWPLRSLIRRIETVRFRMVETGFDALAVDDLLSQVIMTLRGDGARPAGARAVREAAFTVERFAVAYHPEDVDPFLRDLAEELDRLGFL